MWSRLSPFGLGAAVVLASSALAQQPAPGTMGPPPGTASAKEESQYRQHREANLRGAEMVTREKRDWRGVRVAIEEVRKDFLRVQVLRNELAKHVLSDAPLDYKLVAKKTEEIHKRAHRLKTYMIPYAEEAAAGAEEPEERLDAAKMKGALVTLCRSIDSFSENPMFEMPEVVDVQDSARAGGDLQTIIRLSEEIRKEADRLRGARE
jgi:hypothetical protein